MAKSQAELVAMLSPEDRAEVFKDFTEEDFEALQYDWGFWGRPEQSPPPGDWHMFFALAGRGWGKAEPGRSGSDVWSAKTPAAKFSY